MYNHARSYFVSVLVVSVLVVSVLAGCAGTVPEVRTWRPWVRTDESQRTIPLNATLSTKVIGETQALIGDERLRNESMRTGLNQLIERRGFTVLDTGAEYQVVLKYITSNRESFSFSSWNSTISSYRSATATTSGSMGIALAAAIAGKTFTTSSSSVEKKIRFVHTIALEISDNHGDIIRKSDAMWESDEPDATSKLTPALQVLLASLPSDPQRIATVPEVVEGRAENFQALYTEGKWFSCPALAYVVAIPHFESTNGTGPDDAGIGPKNHDYKPRSTMGFRQSATTADNGVVEAGSALAAYLDVIQTSEIALPQGDKNFLNPLDAQLWSQVLLGARYRLTPSNRIVNVLVQLKGSKEGYYADRCWIASDKEFADFQSRLAAWRNALTDYFSVFKK